jgi:hypothetical protein
MGIGCMAFARDGLGTFIPAVFHGAMFGGAIAVNITAYARVLFWSVESPQRNDGDSKFALLALAALFGALIGGLIAVQWNNRRNRLSSDGDQSPNNGETVP